MKLIQFEHSVWKQTLCFVVSKRQLLVPIIVLQYGKYGEKRIKNYRRERSEHHEQREWFITDNNNEEKRI